MLANLREAVTGQMMRVELVRQEQPLAPPDDDEIEALHADPFTGENEMEEGDLLTVAAPRLAADDVDPNDPTTWGKVQRNAPCPCGSGKKFKHCHGRLA